MASYEDPAEVKNWKRERVLGSGGFGTVTLWKHKDGDKMIALKKCRGGADILLTAKQKERWKKEVEIMQRLNHPNVVIALPLPEDLSMLPSDLPMLCMEYCAKGDLRQVLSRPENCCGLPDSDVRRLLQNVSSAVRYLHSEKITHRDLKPENIVLSVNDCGIIYKLIDLGYAKELDQSSLCTSFVGTLQYLAPELFTNEKYSSSVDYWSLGLVSHEVITGIRPFLPNMAPVAWMKHVKRKSSEHICAYQTPDGKIEFSSHLFRQNHISSILKTEMERWLRIVLEWDPKKRGRTADGEVIVFSEIEKILSMKIIRVFCMVTYQRLSYEVEDSTELSKLRTCIQQDTNVLANDQELLLASGHTLDPAGTVNQCFSSGVQEALYVCKKGVLVLPSEQPDLPDMVANMLQYPREKIEYVYQRRAYSHAVFFLQQENKLYRDFLVGCRLKLLSVVLKCQKVIRESQKVMDLIHSVSSLREFCMDACKFDVMRAKKSKVNRMISSWEQQMEILETKWTALNEKGKILIIESQKATKAARKLHTSDFSNLKEDPTLTSLLEEGLNTFDKLKRRTTSERSSMRDSIDMVKVVYNSLKQRDCLLHDQAYNGHLRQLVDCESQLISLLPDLEETYSRLNVLKQEIISVNRERQRNIWDVLSSTAGGIPSAGSTSYIANKHFTTPDSPFLSHSLYSEDHPPPVPPHGASPHIPSYPHSASYSHLQFTPSSYQTTFDTSEDQQPLCRSQSTNGTDSGIASGWNKSVAKGSTSSLSLARQSADDLASAIINENKSLRALTQELVMESLSQLKKVLGEEKPMDWSFLKTA